MKTKESKASYGILAILMIGAFVALLSNTLLNIALPSIMKDFDVSASTVQWLSTGYMLVNGIMIPSTAFLIQKYTARRLFLIAIGLFAIGTFIGGFAPSFPVLLIARMVQASGAAIMMPLLMNVLFTTFPPEKRGSAMGMFGLVMIFAPAIGPTLSGWIIQHYEWPVLFFMIAPIAVLVFILAFFKLHDPKKDVAIKIDILSVVLSAIGFGGLLYGFSSAGNKGWDDPMVYSTLIIGVIGLMIFIMRQMRMKEPMLNFRVYKYPMFALSSAISITLNMAMFSAMMLMPIYLQNIRGISPLDSGLLMLPGALIMGVMSPITGKLFDKFGGKVLALMGLAIVVISTYFFSDLTETTKYSTLMILYSVRMFGISMVMMPVMTNGLNSIPAKYTPHGTAMNSTIQQVSGAIGGALLVTIMSNSTTSHVKDMVAEAVSKLTAKPSAEQLLGIQNQVIAKATIEGINDAFLVSVGVAIIAFILAFFIKRGIQPKDTETVEEKVAVKQVSSARSM
ncbi:MULTISPECIES: DHA2 family efflux MFS transporter permease subunit [Paenibacillus]|uniref:DHA2 family efflux MFS transporter permease subunit n=1 Tax=Paenibacillus TaxID=44249 RepID=UPI002DC06430|nr:DHA2 family efflux MFS transporter permease subunit [Paenibacillus odorifer]MEC0131922.1 DHA2 family efflux MFS transporter permease subunit [Paenibacillus odorifer]MEC0221606.1 DHA2 family efflux MFS transporter permease subunit [Paenibacillus odorifer]